MIHSSASALARLGADDIRVCDNLQGKTKYLASPAEARRLIESGAVTAYGSHAKLKSLVLIGPDQTMQRAVEPLHRSSRDSFIAQDQTTCVIRDRVFCHVNNEAYGRLYWNTRAIREAWGVL